MTMKTHYIREICFEFFSNDLQRIHREDYGELTTFWFHGRHRENAGKKPLGSVGLAPSC